MSSNLFSKELIWLDMDVNSTDEYFAQWYQKLLEKGLVKESFLSAIKAREFEFPTCLPIAPFPVAIPHVDPEHICRPFIAVARFKQAVPWQEMAANDRTLMAKFAFMLGFERFDAHVELLPVLIENFQDQVLIDRMLEAKTTDEFYEVIQRISLHAK